MWCGASTHLVSTTFRNYGLCVTATSGSLCASQLRDNTGWNGRRSSLPREVAADVFIYGCGVASLVPGRNFGAVDVCSGGARQLVASTSLVIILSLISQVVYRHGVFYGSAEPQMGIQSWVLVAEHPVQG